MGGKLNMDNDKIAHDLAIVWVESVLNGTVKPYTEGKNLTSEYLAAYNDALEKLNENR